MINLDWKSADRSFPFLRRPLPLHERIEWYEIPRSNGWKGLNFFIIVAFGSRPRRHGAIWWEHCAFDWIPSVESTFSSYTWALHHSWLKFVDITIDERDASTAFFVSHAWEAGAVSLHGDRLFSRYPLFSLWAPLRIVSFVSLLKVVISVYQISYASCAIIQQYFET